MSEVGEILRKARGIVANGWCQRRVQDGHSYCMLGAVAKAHNGNPHIFHYGGPSHDALELLMKNLPWMPEPPNPDYDWVNQVIPLWNDDATTTKQDVLAVFDKALAEIGEL